MATKNCCPVCSTEMSCTKMTYRTKTYEYWECTKNAAHVISQPGFAKCPVLVEEQRCDAPLVRKTGQMGHYECPNCGHYQ